MSCRESLHRIRVEALLRFMKRLVEGICALFVSQICRHGKPRDFRSFCTRR